MKRRLPGLAPPLALLVLWQAITAAGVFPPVIVPPPAAVLSEFGAMAASGDLARHLGVTLQRLFAGFVPGAAAGALIGLIAGASRTVRAISEPSVAGLSATPKLILLPFALLLFGVGEAARLALVAATAAIPVIFHGMDGIRRVPPGLVELARAYGAGRPQLISRVYLPACLPGLFTGFRLGASQGLILTVSAEMLMPSSGLGSVVWLSWQTLAAERLFVAILSIGFLGAAVYWLLRFAERKIIPWMPGN